MTGESLDVEKLRARDPAATKAFRVVVKRFVIGYFKKDSQVQDFVQQTMLELLAKLEGGAQPKNPHDWAEGTAHNVVRREFTRRQYRTAQFDSTLHRPRPADQSATYRAHDELRVIVEEVLAGDATRLDALEGLLRGEDHRELADRLGVTPGAARMVVARLRAKLNKALPTKRTLAQLRALARSRAGGAQLSSSGSSATAS